MMRGRRDVEDLGEHIKLLLPNDLLLCWLSWRGSLDVGVLGIIWGGLMRWGGLLLLLWFNWFLCHHELLKLLCYLVMSSGELLSDAIKIEGGLADVICRVQGIQDDQDRRIVDVWHYHLLFIDHLLVWIEILPEIHEEVLQYSRCGKLAFLVIHVMPVLVKECNHQNDQPVWV